MLKTKALKTYGIAITTLLFSAHLETWADCRPKQVKSSGAQGYWLTFDDKSKKPLGVVYFSPNKKGLWHGRIIGGPINPNDDGKCRKCSEKTHDSQSGYGLKKNESPMGKVIMWNYKKQGDRKFSGGSIVDNKSGSRYRSTAEWIGDTLKVKGKYLFFSRTVEWKRLSQSQLETMCRKKNFFCLPYCG